MTEYIEKFSDFAQQHTSAVVVCGILFVEIIIMIMFKISDKRFKEIENDQESQ